MEFKKAEKTQAKLRLAITGPSGSGKTYSALQIASGLGKKIAVVDTENHSAATYADDFEFDTLELDPPYTMDKYLRAIQVAHEKGYDVLIIDSITHAWAGEGGLLDKKSGLDSRGGNQYTNWATITKEQELFKSRLLHSQIHLIVTMRSKQDYVLETNERGKTFPKKVGMAPIQRDGMEYEFTIVLDMGMDHQASVSKTRIKSFDNKMFLPTRKTGEEMLAWLGSGKASEVEVPAAVSNGSGIHAEISLEEAGKMAEEIMERLASAHGGDTGAINEALSALTNGKGRDVFELGRWINGKRGWLVALKAKMDKEGIGVVHVDK